MSEESTQPQEDEATRTGDVAGPGAHPGAVSQVPDETPSSEEAPDDVDVHPAFRGDAPVVTPETMYPAQPGAIVETRPSELDENFDPEMGRTLAQPGTQPANAAQLANRLAEEEEQR